MYFCSTLNIFKTVAAFVLVLLVAVSIAVVVGATGAEHHRHARQYGQQEVIEEVQEEIIQEQVEEALDGIDIGGEGDILEEGIIEELLE